VGQEGILVPRLVGIGVGVLVGVLVPEGNVDDTAVDTDVSAGKLGEDDGVASTFLWEGEQALRRKRKIPIKNFFNFMPPAGPAMKNPCFGN